MQQLLLDVFTPPAPSLQNFLPGNNCELLTQVSKLAKGELAETSIFIYGGSGSGKSHLMAALGQSLNQPVLSGKDRFVWRDQVNVLLIDDVEYLTPYSQVQLFNAFNDARSELLPKYIVLSANGPANQIGLREDLASRMAWGLSYRITPLSDEQKQQALLATAHSRGLNLSSEVLDFALIHFKRDMGSLSAVLNGLDQFSLEQHKPVSLNLLRAWMRKRESLVVRNS
jgi:DnaA family protein